MKDVAELPGVGHLLTRPNGSLEDPEATGPRKREEPRVAPPGAVPPVQPPIVPPVKPPVPQEGKGGFAAVTIPWNRLIKPPLEKVWCSVPAWLHEAVLATGRPTDFITESLANLSRPQEVVDAAVDLAEARRGTRTTTLSGMVAVASTQHLHEAVQALSQNSHKGNVSFLAGGCVWLLAKERGLLI